MHLYTQWMIENKLYVYMNEYCSTILGLGKRRLTKKRISIFEATYCKLWQMQTNPHALSELYY